MNATGDVHVHRRLTGGRRRILVAAALIAAGGILVGCGSGGSPGAAPASNPTSAASGMPTETPSAGATPMTTAQAGTAGGSSAQPTCPLTQAQVEQAFGQSLPGPQPPLNAYQVCVFGQTTPGNYHVVTIAEYTVAALTGMGSSAAAYLQANRQPDAVDVPGIGVAAYVQGDNIWVQTPQQGILNIGADFVVDATALTAAATAALASH